mgnify:CR=1 FL=1
MKQNKNIREYHIGNNTYRYVRCQTCGKIFNAFAGGRNSGEAVFYSCPEFSCNGKGRGILEELEPKESFRLISSHLLQQKRISKQKVIDLVETFPEENAKIISIVRGINRKKTLAPQQKSQMIENVFRNSLAG